MCWAPLLMPRISLRWRQPANESRSICPVLVFITCYLPAGAVHRSGESEGGFPSSGPLPTFSLLSSSLSLIVTGAGSLVAVSSFLAAG